MHVLGYCNDFYVKKVLDYGYIELLGLPIELYKACEEIDYGRLIVNSTEPERHVGYLYYVYCVQVGI